MKKDMNSEMPYERFERFGAKSLTDAELLAIILRTGTKGAGAVEVAKKVLELGKYPRCGLMSLYYTEASELEKIPGIGRVKAIKLKCIAELSVRMHEERLKSGFNAKKASSVADFYMERLRHLKNETVMLLSLDSKGKVLSESVISTGSVNKSLVSVRNIFLEALSSEAVNMILIHNHPSGDPTPSADDRRLTSRLYECSHLMEIPLLDHIIIGDNCYYSFSENGCLES
mgnify:CR=1 FL=1